MEDKVTLYIATHNITGKKYFGKTVRWFTQEDLQKNYHGSGKYWNKHKKKHGEKDVTMKIYKICSLNESDDDYVKPIALKFSEENNIVKSDEWANLEIENGLNGNIKGNKHTEEAKEKMSKAQKGKILSDETRLKMCKAKKGNTYGKAQKGRKHTKEHIEKRVKSLKGRKHTEEAKEKMKKSRSEEGKKNISESLKGRKLTEEHKASISEGHKDKIVSEETKGKISKALTGKEKPYEYFTVFLVTSNTGIEYKIIGRQELKRFCVFHNISMSYLLKYVGDVIPEPTKRKYRGELPTNTIGWKLEVSKKQYEK